MKKAPRLGRPPLLKRDRRSEIVLVLAVVARECGKPCVWGTRPDGQLQVLETGPLCSSCDQRAAVNGIRVVQG
jgi:hypothetical protein